MALDSKIVGTTSGNGAEVNASNQLKVITETNVASNPANVGALRVFSENDAGAQTGTATLRSPETGLDWRLRAGVDTLWDDEVFSYTAQNSSKHKNTATTMTASWAGGALNTNSGSITTTATGVQVSTYRHFPVFGAAASYADQYCALSAAMVTNTNLDVGFMIPGATATVIPTDGVYFRINSTGVFGVMNNNGTESTTAVFSFTPTTNQFYKFTIATDRDITQFWIDDVLYGTLAKPANAGAPSYSQTMPWGVRHHHTGTASAAIQFKIASYSISVGDYATGRLWSTQQSGMGLSAIQGPSGFTQGQTANYANSAAPASATLSNTAAGYTTLGGQFQFAAVAGAETDYALFGYQVTTPTANIPGRNLVIRGIWIDTYNTGAAVATTGTVLQWALATGSTAVSLATAEAAAARAPRRVLLGVQNFAVGAAIGAQANRVDVNLDAPVVVEPGSFVHVILKMPIATATASQVIRGIVGINAYWE